MRRQSSLEFDDLRTIIALAEELNFHRAGRRVGLSQPGVTRVLAKVERHVGACLFERSHSKRNSAALTDAGRSYVERARLALAHGDGAVLAARETMHGIDRQLVVGRSPHVDRRLVEILHSIELPLYPNLRVDLPTRYAGELPACIRSGEFDLAIITNPPEDPFLTSTLLRCTPFTVVLPEGHGCAKSQFTSLDHLKSTPWIFFERHVHPALYDAFRDRARGLGIGQERIHHVADAEEACEMVRRIGAAAFLSPRGAANVSKDGVAFCTLRENDLFLGTHLVARAENGSKLVSEFVRNFVKRLKQAGLYEPIPSESTSDVHCASLMPASKPSSAFAQAT
jgi:DNA-binding transcriptional LysR family regulator